MLSRLFVRSLSHHLKTLTLVSSSSAYHSPTLTPLSLLNQNPNPSPSLLLRSLRPFSSSKGDGDGDGSWTFSPESENAIFGEEEGSLAGIAEESEVPIESKRSEVKGADSWLEETKGDIFEGIDKELLPKVGGDEEWETAEGYKPWSLGGDDDGGSRNVFGIGEEGLEGIEDIEGLEGIEGEEGKSEEQMELESKEQELLATLKGTPFF